ncbi:MAG: prepilin peptidase [Alphaproteobacteria bacterium]|nr:prepilin peptidase [Alphaproteobacteria bacterium]
MPVLPNFVEFAVVFVLGLVLGSFATALVYRVPRGISWFWKTRNTKEAELEADGVAETLRSACPSCGHILGVADLVPFFSWLFQRGRCRYCKASIPLQYPLIELTVLVGCIGIYAVYGFTPVAWILFGMIPFLAALLFIDWSYKILPDSLVLAVCLTGIAAYMAQIVPAEGLKAWALVLVTQAVPAAFLYGATAWLMGFVMTKFLGKAALGFGDVKFFAVSGLWLGWESLGVFCALSGFLGLVFALLWRRFKNEQYFPFGPALIAAFYILLLLPGSLLG